MKPGVLSPWMHTTSACNLSCPYCHVKQCAKHMSPYTFRAACRRFIELLRTKVVRHVSLRISGGEPLLRFSKWRRPLEEALLAEPKKLSAEVLTNFTVVPSGFVDFCVKHNIGLAISLDSLTRSKLDRNGESSAAMVLLNIEKLGVQYLRERVAISTVITDSGRYLPALAGYVAQQKFRSWNIEFDKLTAPEDLAGLKHNIALMLDVLQSKHYKLTRLSFENIRLLEQHSKGCQAGSRLITVGTDGMVYPCQTLIGNKLCQLGRVENFGPFAPIEREPRSDCRVCAIKGLCGGGCIFHNCGERRARVCELLRFYVAEAIQRLLPTDR